MCGKEEDLFSRVCCAFVSLSVFLSCVKININIKKFSFLSFFRFLFPFSLPPFS